VCVCVCVCVGGPHTLLTIQFAIPIRRHRPVAGSPERVCRMKRAE
jgi:hypothetical protein